MMHVPFSRRLIDRLAGAEWVAALTGAGISAESGVPTFRGTDGIWKKFRPEELATMNAFLQNPDLVWEWYAHRRKIIAEVQPNAAHHALVKLESLIPHCTVITQNIDNLHRRAGSRAVVELHGNIERNYCMRCGTPADRDSVLQATGVPHCARCGANVRPDVVWFGEMLPDDEWALAVRAAESSEVFLSIGTSAVVYPAASLPQIAHQQGALVVEINPEPTELTSRADEFLQGRAGDIVPTLVAAIEQARQPS
jgi:NAD-dependent deacetylase